MILRVIRGRADRERVVALRGALEDRLGSGADEPYGPDRHHLGIRPRGATSIMCSFLSCWRSAEDARGRRRAEREPTPPRARHGIRSRSSTSRST